MEWPARCSWNQWPDERGKRNRGRKKALSEGKVAELVQRVATGEQKAAIARDLGISRETLYQYLRSAA
jgi:hypothetical protein